jgi:hypothetical protein
MKEGWKENGDSQAVRASIEVTRSQFSTFTIPMREFMLSGTQMQ